MRPVTVGYRVDDDPHNGGHVRVSIFIGENEGARGHSGQLVIRPTEWAQVEYIFQQAGMDKIEST